MSEKGPRTILFHSKRGSLQHTALVGWIRPPGLRLAGGGFSPHPSSHRHPDLYLLLALPMNARH